MNKNKEIFTIEGEASDNVGPILNNGIRLNTENKKEIIKYNKSSDVVKELMDNYIMTLKNHKKSIESLLEEITSFRIIIRNSRDKIVKEILSW